MSIRTSRQTFLQPRIPFAGTILGGLLPEEMVVIQGSVPSDADRFQVDFTCGSSVAPRADVAFHFNPRFRRRPCIVCNTLQKECWGQEEVLRQMPFAAGDAFELIFLVLSDKFKVAVNGAHVLEYKHRVQLERVDTLSISGKVQIQAVGVIPRTVSAPQRSLDKQHQPIISSSGDLSVPFRGELVEGLSVGRIITIKGETHQDADSFVVNLRVPASGGVALQLNPRLKVGLLVRNSFLCGSWGAEETALDSFPFAAGTYFEIIVQCDDQRFRVAVNGLHLLDYEHRVQELSRIRQLEVLGDVALQEVKIL